MSRYYSDDDSVSEITLEEKLVRDNLVSLLKGHSLHISLSEEHYEDLAEQIINNLDKILYAPTHLLNWRKQECYEDAAQMVEQVDPSTQDWVYDDPHELAAAIRRRGEE